MQMFAPDHRKKQNSIYLSNILLLQDNSFMTKTLTSCLLFLFIPFLLKAQELHQPGEAKHVPGVLIFKLKSSPIAGGKAARSSQKETSPAHDLAQLVGAKSLEKAISHTAASSAANVRMAKPHPLSEIYRIEIPENMPLEEALLLLQQDRRVAYAEPYYLPELLETPGDEFLQNQKHLQNIQAEAAWQISQGKSDVIIGILDTGVDFKHPDLQDNLYLNTGEIPNDGIDNDGDGYIDNYRGWDFANNDNDPTADKSDHGTFVTGFSSATTNNDIGIAGTGYKCRYMPLKIFSSTDNSFRNGYEAMVYAADMGCDVINLSWGAPGFRSQYVQDIINYLVLDKDVVIVAAAGNTAEQLDFFPASFDYVLSVSSSNYSDAKADYATWSHFVDILAPGKDVFSTTNGGGYGARSGTSFASPQVAGAAALIRSKFPELSALQVMERLRVSADDISDIKENVPFLEKIGKGRLNMEKALAPDCSPAVRMEQFEMFNGCGPFAFYGDTLEIRMDFINYLSPTTGLKVELSTTSPYATLIEPQSELMAVGTLEKASNQDQPFKVYLHPDLPSNEIITFRLGFTDSNSNYSDFQYFELTTSGSYIDFKSDELALTIASNGNLGYNNDNNLRGVGFRYQDIPLAYNLGLVIAQSPTAVANNMLLTVDPAGRDQDFKKEKGLKLYKNSTASLDARSTFRTNGYESGPLDLVVEQKLLGWEDTLSSASLVLEYRIINTGNSTYEQLHTGLFADFDLREFQKNRIVWDPSHLLGYAFDNEEKQFTGIALLSNYAPAFHALDIANTDGNTSEVGDTISRADKYRYLANGISKQTAGVAGNGNDVAELLGGTIPDLAPGKSKKIAFALLRAASLQELQEAVRLTKSRYKEYLHTPPLQAHLLTCPGNPLEITPAGGTQFQFYSDAEGKNLLMEGSSFLLANPQTDTVIYVANADLSYPGDIERIEVRVIPPLARFSMNNDTLAILAGETAILSLTDQSESPASWKWDFNNGYTSSKQSPKAYFKTTGTYTIGLEMVNTAGCMATSSQQVVVVYKNDVPPISDQLLCSSGPTRLQAEDGEVFNLYADAGKQKKLFEGKLFETGTLQKDTIFYTSRGKGAYESSLQAVKIKLVNTGVRIDYTIDSAAGSTYGIKLYSEIREPELAARIEWYINGTFTSNEPVLRLPYTASDTLINAQALVFYTNGCQAGTEKRLLLKPGAAPLIAPIYTCKGEEVTIRPVEDGIYYFYNDEHKKELLKKGRTLSLPPLTGSRTIWVTNISQGQESAPKAAKLFVPDSLAYFTPSKDTVGLNRQQAVAFTSQHPEVTEWHWDFGDGFTSSLATPEHRYSGPGDYVVRLTASNGQCTDSFSKLITVVQTTGLNAAGGAIRTLKAFPNPAGSHTLVELPLLRKAALLELRSLNGRVLYRQSLAAGTEQLRLELKDLVAGVYLLQLKTSEEMFVHRLIKK